MNHNTERFKRYLEKFPWFQSWRCAKRRCHDAKHKSYSRYGGRGIEFRLSKAECIILWYRDSAYELERPRLDRKDVNGHYTFENCQFISDADNIAKQWSTQPTPTEWSD